MKVKICPECRTRFSCEETMSCWCYSLPHVKLEDITKEKEDCICPKCLKMTIDRIRINDYEKISHENDF